jgi:lipoate-protein ligase A
MNPPGGDGGEQLLFERLELIDDPAPRNAALNMAIDEALLDSLGGDALAPILRVYRWARPAVSFGCFDPWAEVRAMFPEREPVRRWTGGGIVEHGDDFTYSLLAPPDSPLTTLRAAESYRLIHAAAVRALQEVGIAAELEDAPTPNGASRACFVNPVRHDVMHQGRKIAGAAQRRTRRGLLHQGSLHLPLSRYVDITDALARCLAAQIQRRALQPGELAAAAALVDAKYGTPAWLEKF